MPFFTDQLNRTIKLSSPLQRIISIVPSQTELLHYLGLEKEVVGITKFCIHPDEWYRTKAKTGGTKNLNIEKIKGLQPDLIIANKEENIKEQVEELAQHFPVWISDVNTLEDALEMIEDVGIITGKEAAAKELSLQIKNAFFTPSGESHTATSQDNYKLPTTDYKPRVAYFIWKDPYMTVGGDTFINDMLKHAGFENIFRDKSRYPVVTVNKLKAANCQLLLLSSEPYPFKQKHIDELQLQLPGIKIMIADGEAFSWYGSRLAYSPQYFKALHQRLTAIG